MTDLSTLQPQLRDFAAAMPTGLAYYDTKGRFIPAPFHQRLNDALMKVALGKDQNLIVQVPPRHGKSTLASHYFPAWFLGRWPNKNILLASYSAELANLFGRRVRDTLVNHASDVFGDPARIRDDVSSQKEWETVSGGGMLTAGVGGGITGRGFHIGIIDDPVKNDEEANSEVIREKVWTWYNSTFFTRAEPGGGKIVIMTRWHLDDLVGRIVKDSKESGEHWDVIDFPAIALDHDIIGRRPGEALFPERYDVKALERIKRNVGSYWWSALYQQRPAPEGGTIFKREWFRYCELKEYPNGVYYYHLYKAGPGEEYTRVAHTSVWTFQTCDTAATEEESADYFVISTWGVCPGGELLLLDVYRDRIDTTKHIPIVRTQYRKWKSQRLRLVGVEKKNFGLNIIQELRGTDVPIKPLEADKDKLSRALIMSTKYENGLVYHLTGRPWLDAWETELTQFPKGEHDDQVDTAAYAGIVTSHIFRRDAKTF